MKKQPVAMEMISAAELKRLRECENKLQLTRDALEALLRRNEELERHIARQLAAQGARR